jgi:hypothetical protein
MLIQFQGAKAPNNRMHSDSKKHGSSFLVALLFAAGDAEC